MTTAPNAPLNSVGGIIPPSPLGELRERACQWSLPPVHPWPSFFLGRFTSGMRAAPAPRSGGFEKGIDRKAEPTLARLISTDSRTIQRSRFHSFSGSFTPLPRICGGFFMGRTESEVRPEPAPSRCHHLSLERNSWAVDRSFVPTFDRIKTL